MREVSDVSSPQRDDHVARLQGTIQCGTDFVERVGLDDRSPQAGGPLGQIG